jgi:hypothetical protein
MLDPRRQLELISSCRAGFKSPSGDYDNLTIFSAILSRLWATTVKGRFPPGDRPFAFSARASPLAVAKPFAYPSGKLLLG